MVCWLSASISIFCNALLLDVLFSDCVEMGGWLLTELNHDHGSDWTAKMRQESFLEEAIQRLRFRNSWTKEDLCRILDVKMSELHKYLNGEATPPESFLLIVKKELEQLGGYERRGKLRLTELLDRVIELERRVQDLEKQAGESSPES